MRKKERLVSYNLLEGIECGSHWVVQYSPHFYNEILTTGDELIYSVSLNPENFECGKARVRGLLGATVKKEDKQYKVTGVACVTENGEPKIMVALNHKLIKLDQACEVREDNLVPADSLTVVRSGRDCDAVFVKSGCVKSIGEGEKVLLIFSDGARCFVNDGGAVFNKSLIVEFDYTK